MTKGLFSIKEISSENFLTIVNEFYKCSYNFLSVLLARLENDFSREQLLFPQTPTLAPHPVEIKKRVKKEKCLSEFLEKYLECKVADGKKDKRHIPELRSKPVVFLKVATDKPVNAYTRDDIREFRETLLKLPTQFSIKKEYRNKSIKEIAASNNPGKLLSVKTVNEYLIAVSTFFTWLENEGHLQKNLAKGLMLVDNRQKTELKCPFTHDDLIQLFTHPTFISCKESKPFFYWLPWIGLYTGMRIEEIAQLQCSDIFQMDDLWVISINADNPDETNKKIKTKNTRRLMPIHQHLIKLGLIDYKKNIEKNNARLFPELKASGKRKQFAKQMTKEFGEFVHKKLKIEGKKSFNSFRHTFDDVFKRLSLENTTIFKETIGHDTGSLASSQYGSRFTPQECYDQLISKIDYGLDI